MKLSTLLRKKSYQTDRESPSEKIPKEMRQSKAAEEDDLPPELIDALEGDKDKSGPNLEDLGIYYLRGEINERNISPIVTSILEKDLTSFPGEIMLFINSPGGDASEMWSLIDVLHSTRLPVTTIGMGLIASAAAMIVSAGDPGRRFVMPRTEIMVHPFSAGTIGTIHQMKADMKGMVIEYERFVKFWLAHSRYKNRRELERHLLKITDNYMSARQAMKHGIIDGIVQDQRTNKLRALRKQEKKVVKKKKKKVP